MHKGGLIIRLIDVAMIILFGFIAISDIKVRAQIRLPSDNEQESLVKEEKEPVLVFVRIAPDEGFTVDEDNRLIYATRNLMALEEMLLKRFQALRAAGSEMVVLVEPDEDSMIQHTVHVLDICERNRIPKNINYQSMQF